MTVLTMESPGNIKCIADWATHFESGECIERSDWQANPANKLKLVSSSFTSTSTTACFSGGVAKRYYHVINTIKTSHNRVFDNFFVLKLE